MSTHVNVRPAAPVAEGSPESAPPPDRRGIVGVWAIVGIAVLILATQTWGRWILSSTEFSPAPIFGPDEFPTWRHIALRGFEVLTLCELTALVYWVYIRPKRRGERLGLDAKITTGLLIGSLTDGILNMHEYLFAWNSHSVNMGSWARFLPLNSEDHHSRYAEALIWGIPQYTYYCITVASISCWLIMRQRAKNPNLSNVRAYSAVFGAAFVFDFVLENLQIRLHHGYMYAKTPSEVTLWAGTQYQFPLYEPVLVALLGVAFTSLKLSAIDDPNGYSFVERGFQRFRPALQSPLRWLAVIGFCFTALALIYHLPWNWLSINGDSAVYDQLPSYMLPGGWPGMTETP